MRHRRWSAAWATLIFLAAGPILAACGRAAVSGDARGTRAAAFSLSDLRDDTRTVGLEQFAGRPLVVNFWSTTCVPCRKEMPALAAVAARHRDVAFVGIDHEDARSAALHFLAATGVRYPVGFDPEGRTADAYRLRGLPTTVFVRADGTVFLRHTGPLSKAQLLATVSDLAKVNNR
ncbi:MAG: TlpA family protein disulfide reductase [Actinobacteria bacterium]|nr:TlpA family protein disulfide reductase [Actinomycetota bacterium]